MNLIERVKKHEGFKSTPYIDPLVARDPERYGIPKSDFEIIKKYLDKLKLTFGYGFTSIDEDEAEAVLEIKLKKRARKLSYLLPFFNDLPFDIQQLLIEMSYQIGIGGLMKFKKMLAAIEKQNWCEAYKEGKDSRWYRQTPNRAEAVLKPLRERCNY